MGNSFAFQLFKRWFSETKEFLTSYELWRGHFKEIEGKNTI